jgi:hypothetical protein
MNANKQHQQLHLLLAIGKTWLAAASLLRTKA